MESLRRLLHLNSSVTNEKVSFGHLEGFRKSVRITLSCPLDGCTFKGSGGSLTSNKSAFDEALFAMERHFRWDHQKDLKGNYKDILEGLEGLRPDSCK